MTGFESGLLLSELDKAGLKLPTDVKIGIVEPEEFRDYYYSDVVAPGDTISRSSVSVGTDYLTLEVLRVTPFGLDQIMTTDDERRSKAAEEMGVTQTEYNLYRSLGEKSIVSSLVTIPRPLTHQQAIEAYWRELNSRRQGEPEAIQKRHHGIGRKLLNFVSSRSKVASSDQDYPASFPNVLSIQHPNNEDVIIADKAAIKPLVIGRLPLNHLNVYRSERG